MYRTNGKEMYKAGSGDNECDCEKKKINYWEEEMYRSGEGNKKSFNAIASSNKL